jgi:hypothetical protein
MGIGDARELCFIANMGSSQDGVVEYSLGYAVLGNMLRRVNEEISLM